MRLRWDKDKVRERPGLSTDKAKMRPRYGLCEARIRSEKGPVEAWKAPG